MRSKKTGIKLLILTLFLAIPGLIFFQPPYESSGFELPDEVDFNFDVKPILVQNCYLCHGPDPSSRKAGLRMDTYEGATALTESGIKAIVPGKSRKSEMIRRILHEDDNMVMPPPESHLKLTDYQVAILKKWIDQGAEWKQHWAFIEPKIDLRENQKDQQPSELIDSFIRTKLDASGLESAVRANRYTLIRRVSYILTGLPPTQEKIREFISDERPDAYEKMVDHYLASQRFGERWARHWMDIVRYAETKGHEFDYEILGAWKYRDYLIRAFNDDLPYDQLLREHIAGDLVDSIRWNPQTGINESQLGTAFYALGEGTHSPVDIRKDEADRVDNIIDVTTKAFQGLTVSCARCHDHKFDPIPTADYYALYGVIESTRFSPKSTDFTKTKQEELDKIERLKEDIMKIVAVDIQNTEETASVSSNEYIGDFRGVGLDGWKSDGIAFGHKTTLGEPVFDKSGSKILYFDSGKVSSRQLTSGIYGALRSPNFVIDKNFIGVRALGKQSTIRIIIDNFQLIQNPIYGGLTKKVDQAEWQNISFDVSAWKGHKAYIEIIPGVFQGARAHNYELAPDAYVEAEYAIEFDGQWPEKVPAANPAISNSIRQVEALNARLKSGKLQRNYPDASPLVKLTHELSRQLADSSFFVGVSEGFGINSPVFIRGNHKELSEEKVQRRFLTAISEKSFDREGSGRMELAEAMLSSENPLTARVMVNRIWHHLFGRGIVETVDNFGLQGKLPSHPELLDYLAIQFRKEGWSVKKMIKHVVMSGTFQAVVTGSPEAEKTDPDNLLLSHFPLRRLESEAIRDGLLFASGNINYGMYGPAVPVYLTEFMQGRGRPRESGPLDGNGRRSIYQDVRRNFLQPMMLTFDRPIPFSTFGKRNNTNVPAQSLILMNDPFVIHQAGVMAQSIIDQSELSQHEKFQFVYMQAFSRLAGENELKQMDDFIDQLSDTYQVASQAVAENHDVWRDFCHAIFNLKEFIYLI